MAVAIAQSITAKNSSASVNFASWTVNPNELLLVMVTMRSATITPTVSGNGVTWTSIIDQVGVTSANRLVVFRAMPSSASTGAITVTATGNSLPIVCFASRFTGVNTGSNGANAIDVSGTDFIKNAHMLKAIITVADNTQVVAIGTHRNKVFTVPTGETGIIINESQGSSGDQTESSWWQQTAITTPPGSVTMGASNDLSGSVEWIIAALAIKGPNIKSLIGTLTSTGGNSSKTVGKPTLGSVVLFGSSVAPLILKVAAGTMNFVGAFTKQIPTHLSAALTFLGDLAVRSKGFVNLGASLFMSGTMPAKPIFKKVAGLWQAQGNPFKAITKVSAFTGTLTMSGLKRAFIPNFDTFVQFVNRIAKQILKREKL